MSEFTVGTLFRTSECVDKTFSEMLADKDRIEKLNDIWSVILMEDQYLSHPATVEKLAELSRKKPLLYFYNAEDHGWGWMRKDTPVKHRMLCPENGRRRFLRKLSNCRNFSRSSGVHP
ncbi:hypothetical protein N0M98_12185 [Paenibacillus doosanensis]|uniref:hypothetical protein n=1 Tax=Paenibacillus doosanensis TaxID=1229154 RepID=UPI00218066B8|nr:hypothetical protein [Paenibacillus doosanensis]MCS7460902.1 hypothetical protein [Paenibacillus doosanensis]